MDLKPQPAARFSEASSGGASASQLPWYLLGLDVEPAVLPMPPSPIEDGIEGRVQYSSPALWYLDGLDVEPAPPIFSEDSNGHVAESTPPPHSAAAEEDGVGATGIDIDSRRKRGRTARPFRSKNGGGIMASLFENPYKKGDAGAHASRTERDDRPESFAVGLASKEPSANSNRTAKFPPEHLQLFIYNETNSTDVKNHKNTFSNPTSKLLRKFEMTQYSGIWGIFFPLFFLLSVLYCYPKNIFLTAISYFPFKRSKHRDSKCFPEADGAPKKCSKNKRKTKRKRGKFAHKCLPGAETCQKKDISSKRDISKKSKTFDATKINESLGLVDGASAPESVDDSSVDGSGKCQGADHFSVNDIGTESIVGSIKTEAVQDTACYVINPGSSCDSTSDLGQLSSSSSVDGTVKCQAVDRLSLNDVGMKSTVGFVKTEALHDAASNRINPPTSCDSTSDLEQYTGSRCHSVESIDFLRTELLLLQLDEIRRRRIAFPSELSITEGRGNQNSETLFTDLGIQAQPQHQSTDLAPLPPRQATHKLTNILRGIVLSLAVRLLSTHHPYVRGFLITGGFGVSAGSWTDEALFLVSRVCGCGGGSCPKTADGNGAPWELFNFLSLPSFQSMRSIATYVASAASSFSSRVPGETSCPSLWEEARCNTVCAVRAILGLALTVLVHRIIAALRLGPRAHSLLNWIILAHVFFPLLLDPDGTYSTTISWIILDIVRPVCFVHCSSGFLLHLLRQGYFAARNYEVVGLLENLMGGVEILVAIVAGMGIESAKIILSLLWAEFGL